MILKKIIIITLVALQILFLTSCHRPSAEKDDIHEKATDFQIEKEPTESRLTPTAANKMVDIETESVVAVPGEGELDEYGSQYEKNWKSDDGRISFLMNNKFGFEISFAGCEGSYLGKSGKSHKVRVDYGFVDGYYVIILLDDVMYGEGTAILDGTVVMDEDEKGFTLTSEYPEVEDETVYCDESVYSVEGEKIHFFLDE